MDEFRKSASRCVLLVSLFACSVLGYTDSEECGSHLFGIVKCTSLSYFYRECDVPGAEAIHLIKLHQNMSRERCEFKSTFGFRDNVVWVTDGCSGVFYLCYDGEYVSSDKPPVTVTTKAVPTKPSTNQDTTIAVGKASTASDNDVLIYIIAASCVVLLVCIGLVIGCVVRRRQQSETANRLAEKRQIRIALKEHIEDREEHGVSALPLATRSLSVESVPACEFEKEESDFSSRSSTSEMTSVSAQTPGNFVRNTRCARSSVSFYPSGRLKKGYSTPDIHALGRMYCEANMMNRQNKHSATRDSQNSLNSIREVCNKYQIFDIPLEKRIKRQSRRSVKFGSVGFLRENENRSSKGDMNTLPRHKTTVSAIVHYPARNQEGQLSRSSSIKSNRSGRMSLKEFEPSKLTIYEQPVINTSATRKTSIRLPRNESQQISKEETPYCTSNYNQTTTTRSGHDVISHYHDPDSLRLRQPPPIPKKPICKISRPESPSVKSQISNPDNIYSQVMKQKPKIMYPKPDMSKLAKPVNIHTHNIYATVKKSMVKATSKLPPGASQEDRTSKSSINYFERPYQNPFKNSSVSGEDPLKHRQIYSSVDYRSVSPGNIDSQTKYSKSLEKESFVHPNVDRNKTDEFGIDNPVFIDTVEVSTVSKSGDAVSKSQNQANSYPESLNTSSLNSSRDSTNPSITESRGMDNLEIGDTSSLYTFEDDEEDVAVIEKDFIYARMETFKPAVTSPVVIQGLTDTMSHI